MASQLRSERLREAPISTEICPAQWKVFGTCYAGGMFDGLDSSLFTAILPVAIAELLNTHDPAIISQKGSWVAALFLLGWTAGGALFGGLADRIGRVKALSISILIYALFTGLCGLAHTWQQLAFFRFMTALGIGGELIVGTTLLAESWPENQRSKAIGWLTTAYQCGLCLVGLSNLILGQLGWRYLFLVGALPALMVMFIRRKVQESPFWVASCQTSETKSQYWDLFQPQHFRNLFFASAFTGILLITYWASSFWIPAWIHQLLPGKKPIFEVSSILLLQGFFAMGGSVWAGYLSEQIGRRWTVVTANVCYLITSIGMFALNSHFSPAIYLWGAAMGLSIGIAIGVNYIYVPELFPTQLRASGTGFCFNLGRIAAALGVIYSGTLVRFFNGSFSEAALTISYVLILGVVAVLCLPETKGKSILLSEESTARH